MSGENFFLMVRCLECTQRVCTLVCTNAALVFVHGDLLIDARKCSGCGRSTLKDGLPGCVADCPHANQKAVITETSLENKRTQAVNAMSLIL
ncbi:MAG: hypothetical protein LBH18_01070 [Spirochaetaceae bacterium]|jgi:Fe-S-cluster-containing hydrogenase component 2|nr:hypothetical protein [Spirochaetaceae bacterium]